MRRPVQFLVLTFALFTGGAAAETPAAAAFGNFTPLPQAHEQADATLEYKVVFDISQAAKSPDQVNPGLDRAARLTNMLAAGGVSARKRHVVTIVHGPAADAVVSDAAYAARHDGAKNPNSALIAALQAMGVSVRICGQAMTGQHIAATELAQGVQLDLAALVTVTNFQLKGYALIVN